MDNESGEPIPNKPVPGAGDGENALIPAPGIATDPDADFGEDSTRHDGWTGRRMAMFCALLAETGIVTDACHAVGMSTTSAYSARRRNPLFAAAWEEALSLARNRLADALLERSLAGSVEKYYRDGELVGEKRVLDNKLGVAILRRLDARAAQLPAAPAPVRPGRTAMAPAPAQSPDWDLMLAALKSGDEEMMAEAMVELRKAEGHEVGEVGEVCVAGNSQDAVNFDDAEDEEPDPRCWWDEQEECWMTDFPPPAGFAGYQKGHWGDEAYNRECTKEESAALQAALDSETAEERAEDEAERDNWFAALERRSDPERHRHPDESQDP